MLNYLSFLGCVDEVGIENWNEFEDEYAFVYMNPEKDSKKVLVKCLVMDDKFLVDAVADGGSEPVHLEIKYVFLPSFSSLFSNYFVVDFQLVLFWF